jgi:hypothetical protein
MANKAFLPTEHGFAFTNNWPSQPAVVLDTPFGKIDVGNAAGGLCGGMVFAVLDYWHKEVQPPSARPALGSPLYSHIVHRLIDSWHLPAGVVQYYQWMNLPDQDSGFNVVGRRVITERGLPWRTINTQWSQIKADLDEGIPVPLGIVTVASGNPKDLGRNHQILAYDYETAGHELTVRVYDPNRGQRDDISIRFDAGNPGRRTQFDHNLGINGPVRGFFRTAYRPAPLPAD